MNDRYADRTLTEIWNDDTKLEWWIRIELAAIKVQFGEQVFEDCQRSLAFKTGWIPSLADLVREREKTTGHDVAAFVEVCAEVLDEGGKRLSRYFHHHLTSSDIVDTANAGRIWSSWYRITKLEGDLVRALELKASHPDLQTTAVGRTHGRAALPVKSCQRFEHASVLLQQAYQQALDVISHTPLAKIGGPTGSEISEKAERHILEILQLPPAPRPHIQCASRTYYFRVFAAIFEVALVLEKLAMDLRLLAIEEVGEVNEGYRGGRVGSSSMPHKRNPVNLEKVCGLVRVMRGHLMAFSENSALWLERDISHSSAERLLMPDFFHCLAHCLETMTKVVDGLEVFPDRIAANLAAVSGKMGSFEQLHQDADLHGRTESHRRAATAGADQPG